MQEKNLRKRGLRKTDPKRQIHKQTMVNVVRRDSFTSLLSFPLRIELSEVPSASK